MREVDKEYERVLVDVKHQFPNLVQLNPDLEMLVMFGFVHGKIAGRQAAMNLAEKILRSPDDTPCGAV